MDSIQHAPLGVDDAEVILLADILERWDMTEPPNDWTGHSYEDIARDCLTQLSAHRIAAQSPDHTQRIARRMGAEFVPHAPGVSQRDTVEQSPAPNTTAQGDEALVERDRIVAWLRTMQDYRWRLKLEADTGEIEILQGAMSQAYQNAADAIERGDHRAALKSGSAKP